MLSTPDPPEAQYELGHFLSIFVFLDFSSSPPIPQNLACFIANLKAFLKQICASSAAAFHIGSWVCKVRGPCVCECFHPDPCSVNTVTLTHCVFITV